MKKKTVKAWAVVGKIDNELLLLNYGPMEIFAYKYGAFSLKSKHPEKLKVVPCVITYTL